MLAAIQEERLQKLEEKVSEVHAEIQSHTSTDDLRFQMITKQIGDVGDRLVEKIDAIASDVTILKNRTDTQAGSIARLKEKETARERRRAAFLKLLWIIPGAALVELGHQLVQHFWK